MATAETKSLFNKNIINNTIKGDRLIYNDIDDK